MSKPVCARCGGPRLDWQEYCGAACSALRNVPVEWEKDIPTQVLNIGTCRCCGRAGCMLNAQDRCEPCEPCDDDTINVPCRITGAKFSILWRPKSEAPNPREGVGIPVTPEEEEAFRDLAARQEARLASEAVEAQATANWKRIWSVDSADGQDE